MAAFGRLIRFKDASGSVFYGEVEQSSSLTEQGLTGLTVPIYNGSQPWDDEFALTGEKKIVETVLCPLPQTPTFMCVGLNYRQHADEAGAELCLVIGTDCKDLKESDDPWQYILGYMAGNDISSRYWQAAERSGGQHGSGKWFDKFAPIGPTLVSSRVISDPHQLLMKSIVNGEERQSTRTDDMIFDIPAILRHLSRGLTLRKGTVIMTGTPSGVAAFHKPPKWLQEGDVVEIEIEKIGRMRNVMSFYDV
ncbi:hypothetical protein B0A52_06749 [Exophiala mesophila]|uniref:Fumarylacetoacetase-like C-terminal domain-containing protein n=1 Tax=Exophiala mesophila TaxID=212818 RepID=A0A438N011_EXOME|nr:hypothetical protein B0A52_06749 [Exophiala mesophila]